MVVETVKVYKGNYAIVINKTDVEEYNKKGFKTSSQQKKSAAVNKKDDKE